MYHEPTTSQGVRQELRDSTWFDPHLAESWEEDTWWDGQANISRATGCPFDHEKLYLTRKGAWVLYHWSDEAGALDWYHTIEKERAKQWLLVHGYRDHAQRLWPGDVFDGYEI